MIDLNVLYKRLTLAMCASLAIQAVGCGSDSADPLAPDAPPVIPDPDDPPPPPPPPTFSTRLSRASTIAISDNDALVAMVNPDDGSLSVFKTSDHSRISKTPTGGNPSSVVIAGDNKTAYVASRNEGTVARVINIDGGTPSADASVRVGAEPVALALAPSGTKLFVAEFAQSRVSVINTATMQIESSVEIDRPRGLVVTNNGDASDADELLVVSQFFGVAVAGKEGKDDGRLGKIVSFPLSSVVTGGGTEITFAPRDSGFKVGGVETNAAVFTAPNQLAAVATDGGRAYVTSVSASPQGPLRFDNNVFPVVYVADLQSGTEVRGADGTANLAQKIKVEFKNREVQQGPQSAANPRFIPGDLSDIAFLGTDTRVAYAVGKASDVMVRIVYGAAVNVGSTQNVMIDLNPPTQGLVGCQAPIGLVVSDTLKRAYVNCWVTRRLGLVNFASQTLQETFESVPPPVSEADKSVLRGKRFFFTGRGRWSNDGRIETGTPPALPTVTFQGNGSRGGEGWSSCGSCHPDGLTDNITWSFAAGPRQTTSMDGSFSHGPGIQKQRQFNWTAVNDEMHDFEGNTRTVSGGIGALTASLAGTDCSALDKETSFNVALNGALAVSNKFLADNGATVICRHADWDDINNYVKTITPVHASKLADQQSIERGRQLFEGANCAQCHGGPGWTVSNRPYDPNTASGTGATTLTGLNFSIPAFLATVIPNVSRTQISAQPAIGAEGAVAVQQLACVLRDVRTFGVPPRDPDDAADVSAAAQATTALEVRVNGTRAQGFAGFNVPSLYGLSVGAPYLHHGQAATLTELFTDPRWDFHTTIGDANFRIILRDAEKLKDLITFLVSIDSSTEEFDIPTDPNTSGSAGSFDACAGQVK